MQSQSVKAQSRGKSRHMLVANLAHASRLQPYADIHLLQQQIVMLIYWRCDVYRQGLAADTG